MRLLFILMFIPTLSLSQINDSIFVGEPAKFGGYIKGSYLGTIERSSKPIFRYSAGLFFTYDIMFARVGFLGESDGYSGISIELMARVLKLNMCKNCYMSVYPGTEMSFVMRSDRTRTQVSWGLTLRYSAIFFKRLEVAIEIPVSARMIDRGEGGRSVNAEWQVGPVVSYYLGARKRKR